MNLQSIKFLIDVGVGKGVEEFLAIEGFDTKAVRDINPSMSDREVLRLALTEKRMIITMDKDFGELVYKSNLGHEGILVLRIEDANIADKVRIISEIVTSYIEEINNSFCIYHRGKLRIRRK